MFVCSENVVNTQNNYTAVVWIPRWKNAEILNKTLPMILCRSTIRSYVNTVFDCIKSNDLTMNYLFRFLKIWLFFFLQLFYFWIKTLSARKNVEIYSLFWTYLYTNMYYLKLTNHMELLKYLVIYIKHIYIFSLNSQVCTDRIIF